MSTKDDGVGVFFSFLQVFIMKYKLSTNFILNSQASEFMRRHCTLEPQMN